MVPIKFNRENIPVPVPVPVPVPIQDGEAPSSPLLSSNYNPHNPIRNLSDSEEEVHVYIHHGYSNADHEAIVEIQEEEDCV